MKKNELKVLFMGTPEFAKEILEYLVENKFNIVGVFTNLDKPKGRDLKLACSPVKEYASSKNIKVYQPSTLKQNEEVKKVLDDLNPDIIIVAAYGKILPKYILDFPRFGSINVHASILPKYRGAAPINWAIINGETTTGVTIMYMDEGMDTGDIILKAEIEINYNDTFKITHDKLAMIGKLSLVEVLEDVVNEIKIYREKQVGEYSIAPMLNELNTKLDFTKDANSIYNLVRGLNPYPLATCKIDDNRQYKIYETNAVLKDEVENYPNIDKKCLNEANMGEIVYLNDKKNLLIVKCNNSYINISKLKPKNSKLMTSAEYIRGNKIKLKEKFI